MRHARTSIIAALTILLVGAIAEPQPSESPPLPGYGWGGPGPGRTDGTPPAP